MFLPKDFVETNEGLLFAVVAAGLENGKVRCFLRYVQHENGQWQKINTENANNLLAENYPDYCFHSTEFDAFLHAVSVEKIINHYQPRQRLQQLLTAIPRDEIEKNCVELCALFEKADIDLAQFGVTGSLLVGQQKATSDIDLVCYDMVMFHHARTAIKMLIEQEQLTDLQHEDWLESYQRRDCELRFDEYVWHERRKANKALIHGRKFDLSLVEIPSHAKKDVFTKLGKITLQTKVIDDSRAFCYPAEFKIAHPQIKQVVCFTATYTGQAVIGEMLEVAGQLEQDKLGNQRIVVGSSREARGEYIVVVCETKC